MKKSITIFFLAFCFACGEKNHRHDETIIVPSEDTSIVVKISYPAKQIEKDKLIIWSRPPLNLDFYPDSIADNNQLGLSPVLRNKLPESGYITIEYVGRSDSILFCNRKYRASSIYTNAVDLENLLAYINKDKRLKNKKIVLIGYSEGGDVNCIVGSKQNPNVVAMVQLASVARHGKENLLYQREQNFFDMMLLIIRHGHQDTMDSMTNKMSSLDSYHKADIDGSGAKQFMRENIEPVEDLIYQFDSNDSIYFHIDLYLHDRWMKENEETKGFWKNNYESYYQAFAGNITPQQIAIRTFEPEKYYPYIKCPVLAVHGTEDRRVECYSNMEKMEQLLSKGGNNRFDKIILEGYNHDLMKRAEGKNQYFIEESVIDSIIDWVNKQ